MKYSSNLDDVIKSEREDLTEKTEKFRQVTDDFEIIRLQFAAD